MRPHVFHLLRAHGVIGDSEPISGRTHHDLCWRYAYSIFELDDNQDAAFDGSGSMLPPSRGVATLDDGLEYCEERMLDRDYSVYANSYALSDCNPAWF